MSDDTLRDDAPEADPGNDPLSGTVIPDPWLTLRRHTPARIGLGRAGVSQPTSAHLAFQLAHAQARDAVHRGLDHEALAASLSEAGLETLDLHSAATDRTTYLQRPDLGRRLDDGSTSLLTSRASDDAPDGGPDLALIVADGLSALAIERHALAFIAALRPMLAEGWRWAPVAVVRQARVAIGDPIGHALGAKLAVVLIGERPGLSSPDSMGVYVTWAPRPGRTDAERNCISNVRPEGLAPEAAAARLAWLLNEARSRQVTGVALKDESADAAPAVETTGTFRLDRR